MKISGSFVIQQNFDIFVLHNSSALYFFATHDNKAFVAKNSRIATKTWIALLSICSLIFVLFGLQHIPTKREIVWDKPQYDFKERPKPKWDNSKFLFRFSSPTQISIFLLQMFTSISSSAFLLLCNKYFPSLNDFLPFLLCFSSSPQTNNFLL